MLSESFTSKNDGLITHHQRALSPCLASILYAQKMRVSKKKER